MDIIKLRDYLSCLIEAGYGRKKAGIAQVTYYDYDDIVGFTLSPDSTTILICTWNDERIIDKLIKKIQDAGPAKILNWEN